MAAMERDQLLFFPKPLMPTKGFSCRSATRPCLATTLSMTHMTTRFWLICTVLIPYYRENSNWPGATSRCWVLSGMPILKCLCSISFMYLRACP